jgi:hypothetical protein
VQHNVLGEPAGRQHLRVASIRQHASAYVSNVLGEPGGRQQVHTRAYVSIRQHTPAYVSIPQHTSAYVCQHIQHNLIERECVTNTLPSRKTVTPPHTSAYVSVSSITE